jgi:outer membrane protein TolC
VNARANVNWWNVLSIALALAALGAGCTASKYAASADRETYGAIAQKGAKVPNMDRHFTVDQTNTLSLDGLPVVDTPAEFLGPYLESERGAPVVPLTKALEVGVQHSRAYQTSKEQLYLSGLALTLARRDFAPIFSGSGAAGISGQTEQATQLIPDPKDPTKFLPVLSDDLVEQDSIRANGSVRVDWLLRDIGRISAAFTADFSRFITGDPRTFTSSLVGATFTRPLLRNAGFKQEKEDLLQAERNLLYALRTFTQYRKTFTVQIASAYYGVLRSRDAVRNSYLNLQNSRRMGERNRALADEGRYKQSDLGRIETQILNAESGWLNSVRTYKSALDNFKLTLGVSTDAKLVLDDQELTALRIRHPDISAEDAIKVAAAARLDYQNLRDQLDDASRRVKLAADNLKMQIDLVAAGSFNNNPGDTTGFPAPQPNRYRWSAGLAIDPALDRKPQRNAYRSALIAQAQAARAATQLEDQVKLDVRDNWRALEQAKRSYEISEASVKTAERRVEEQNLLAELGRSSAVDQVDAQNSLIEAMNQRTQALVEHTIARLRFWDSMGILYVKENGQWQEGTYDNGQ